jgi:hypothetical protein
MSAAECRQKVVERLTAIERDLAHHISRTELLEKRIEAYEKVNSFLTISGRLLVIGAAGTAIAKYLLG